MNYNCVVIHQSAVLTQIASFALFPSTVKVLTLKSTPVQKSSTTVTTNQNDMNNHSFIKIRTLKYKDHMPCNNRNSLTL